MPARRNPTHTHTAPLREEEEEEEIQGRFPVSRCLVGPWAGTYFSACTSSAEASEAMLSEAGSFFFSIYRGTGQGDKCHMVKAPWL